MSYRMSEMDCAQARMQNSTGVSAIHALWLYDRPVDIAAVTAFDSELRRGRLGRGIVSSKLAAAGDRWTTNVAFADVVVSATAIARDGLEEWISEQAGAVVTPYGGPGWRTTVARLDDGGSVVSLLVSHALTDGLWLVDALVDAVRGKEMPLAYPSDDFGAIRTAIAETGSAVRQLGRVARMHVRYRRALAVERKKSNTTLDLVDVITPLEPVPIVPLEPGFRIPRVTAVVDATQWAAAAEQRGGSVPTLSIAVAAKVAAAIGRTNARGNAVIGMPVSTRSGPSDLRANAVRSICFEVDVANGIEEDLRPLRAKLKSELGKRAAALSGEDVVVATYQAVPRFWLARNAWSSLAPDYVTTGCTMAGGLDDAILRIDGFEAASVTMGLVNSGIEHPDHLAKFGGNLWFGGIGAGGSVALRVSGFHSQNLRNADQMKAALSQALDDYGLTPTYW